MTFAAAVIDAMGITARPAGRRPCRRASPLLPVRMPVQIIDVLGGIFPALSDASRSREADGSALKTGAGKGASWTV
jgi:hypothetical protein